MGPALAVAGCHRELALEVVALRCRFNQCDDAIFVAKVDMSVSEHNRRRPITGATLRVDGASGLADPLWPQSEKCRSTPFDGFHRSVVPEVLKS